MGGQSKAARRIHSSAHGGGGDENGALRVGGDARRRNQRTNRGDLKLNTTTASRKKGRPLTRSLLVPTAPPTAHISRARAASSREGTPPNLGRRVATLGRRAVDEDRLARSGHRADQRHVEHAALGDKARRELRLCPRATTSKALFIWGRRDAGNRNPDPSSVVRHIYDCTTSDVIWARREKPALRALGVTSRFRCCCLQRPDLNVADVVREDEARGRGQVGAGRDAALDPEHADRREPEPLTMSCVM